MRRLVLVVAVALLLVLTVTHTHGAKLKHRARSQTRGVGDLGDYICTETLKASFTTMFSRKDVISTAQDNLALCALCARISGLAFLYVNDIQLQSNYQQNVKDNACRHEPTGATKDCHTLADAMLLSLDSFFRSPAAVLSSKTLESSDKLTRKVQVRANSLCNKVKCCLQQLYTEKDVAHYKEKQHDCPVVLPTVATNNASDFTSDMAPSAMAAISLAKQADRIILDRKSLQSDWEAVRHEKEIIESDRSQIANRAKLVLDKEKEIDKALKVGTIKCKPWQIPKPNNTCDCRTCFNQTNGTSTDHGTSPVSGSSSAANEHKFQQISAASTILSAPEQQQPVVEYNMPSSLPPAVNALMPTPPMIPANAPALPPGYAWQYKMVVEDE